MARLQFCFRWPVTITAANKTLRFQKGASFHSVDLTEGDYYVEGDDSADDLVRAFREAWEAAYLALYGVAATFATSIGTNGRLQMAQSTGSLLTLVSSGSTFPVSYFGDMAYPVAFRDVFGDPLVFTSLYQVGASWYPGTWDSEPPEVFRRSPVVETYDLRGRPHRVLHAAIDDDWAVKRVAFEDIPGARMLFALANDATAAAVAGITQNDPNAPFEAWLAALRLNKRAKVYYGLDPSTAVVSGPYYVKLDEGWIAGVPFDAVRSDRLLYRFRLSLEFVE